jgi:hypothetical protein
MACLADFNNVQLRQFESVRENYRQFKGHVSLKAQTWLIGLFHKYGENTLNGAIDACFLRDWKEPSDLEVVSELIKVYTREVVMSKIVEHGKAAWKSPRSFEEFLKGTIRPKTFSPNSAYDGNGPKMIDRRPQGIYDQNQAIMWLHNHAKNTNDFFDYFDKAGESEPVGKNLKPVRLFQLKTEYR